jgi:hypothetical protein
MKKLRAHFPNFAKMLRNRMDWIHLAQDKDKLWALINMVTNF